MIGHPNKERFFNKVFIIVNRLCHSLYGRVYIKLGTKVLKLKQSTDAVKTDDK